MKDIVVMKFGGTSLMTPEQRKMAASRIIEMKNSGKKPVVVVSAMGRFNDAYATDTLLRLLKDENPSCHNRHLDMIASCGEIISASIMAETLRSMGFEAIALNAGQAGIQTDSNHGNANIECIDTRKILNWLSDGSIAIVTGFQGLSKDGFLTTLGRGGSDFSAVALAKALDVDTVYILKDVPGVLTADPKITKKARLIQNMTYEELYEMSKSGAKVVNFKAVSSAKRDNINLVVKSLFSPIGKEGTVITRAPINVQSKKHGKLLTAIVSKDNLLQYSVSEKNSKILADLLKALSENEISIDMISMGKGEQLFAIDLEKRDLADSILNESDIAFSCRSNCSKLTIVGQAIHGVPGVMASLLAALNSIGVEILQTSDSHTTISCIMESKSIAIATEKLHDVFNL